MNTISLRQKAGSISAHSPSHIRRFVAFAIDWYLGSILVSLPVSIAYYQYFPQQSTILDIRVLPFTSACITLFASLIIACLYYVVLPYRMNGQTLGKKLMKLRITEKGKQQISWRALCIRQIIGIIVIEGSVYTISPLIYQLVCFASDQMLSSITYIHYALTIASIACLLFTKNRCAIHDYLAHTQVEAI